MPSLSDYFKPESGNYRVIAATMDEDLVTRGDFTLLGEAVKEWKREEASIRRKYIFDAEGNNVTPKDE